MKCASCAGDKKDKVKACKKCRIDFTAPVAWFPDAKRHLKPLGIIYAAVIVFYFGVSAILSKMPRPYELRHIPIEMTPSLVKGGKVHLPEDELKAPAREPDDPPAPAAK